MIHDEILFKKITNLMRHLNRIRSKSSISLDDFLNDIDSQEIILFNLQMAIQNCIDMASHIVSIKALGLAGSTNELFYMLEDEKIIEMELTEKMVKAVGFRNLIVHEYGKVDLKIVYHVCNNEINDLELFSKTVYENYH